jgi:hypothetical protein
MHERTFFRRKSRTLFALLKDFEHPRDDSGRSCPTVAYTRAGTRIAPALE